MQFVEAGGARIPILGLGTFGIEGRDCSRAVEQALRLGYRLIDTAQIYDNEREVGDGIRASGVPRNDVFLITKVWTTRFAPNELVRSVKDSVSRLRAEIDLLLLHWPSPQVPLAETLQALAKVKELGLARHIGLSNFTVALMEEAIALSREPLICDQVEYHPYLDQTKIINACRAHGLAAIAYSPLAKGRIKNDETLIGIGRKYGKSPAQICLRWLIQQNVVAIPRTSKVERLSENLDVFDFVLSEDDIARLFAMGSPEGRITNFGFAPQWD